MKKFTLILATVALLAAGCTKTEVVGPQNRKGINFAAYTAKTTKALQTDVTTGNLSAFEVTAFGNGAIYFDNLTFTKNTVWESDPKYFWPAFPLTFCAYNTPIVYNNPADPDKVAKITGFERRITTTTPQLLVSPAAELAYQQDLVAAYAAGKKESDATSTGNSLLLTFNHYLTQVIVKATNARYGTYTVVVDSVKIANMAGHGIYTFSDNRMRPIADSKTDYKAGFQEKTLDQTAQEVMPDTDAGKGKWYLIPQSVTSWDPNTNRHNTNHGTYLALKVKITANNEALKIYPATADESKGYISGWMAVPIPSGFIFEQGKKYTFNIHFFSAEKPGAGYVDPEAGSDLNGDGIANDNGKKIIGGEIKFNAYVDGWNNYNVDINL